MNVYTCTLLADGSSDQVLLPILLWLLGLHCPMAHTLEYAPVRAGRLAPRIAHALQDFPCDLLFVHRDAEGDDAAQRQEEIQSAWSARHNGTAQLVSVIPVRMTEAWLLFDEVAIRRAAGNPSGRTALKLPKLARLEQLPDPKEVLFDALRSASGLSPNRLKRFNPDEHRRLVTERASDFAPLRQLPGFARLEAQVQAVFQS